ncbi:MAG: pirin family protein [Polyangiaceae bacterium]|nr:pirin family protein [Polyangiaceae bacterium]
MRVTRRDLLRGAASSALFSFGCGSSDEPVGAASPAAVPEARPVLQVVAAQRTRDGAGVALARSIGSRALPMLDPFLMLDEIRSDRAGDYIAGFPDHPHRGFETVTYMIDGAMEHRDSVGNHGLLRGGSIQWMTAGRGIVHSEMPKQEGGLLWGFQLWVNLPKRLKMTTPRYQDIAPADVPEVSGSGAHVRVAAGDAFGAKGPIRDIIVAPTLLDVRVPANATFTHEASSAQSAFAYVLDGGLEIGGERIQIDRGHLAVLGPGATIVARTGSREGRMLLVMADPIGEPVARRGPFVMNTDDEIDQAFADYRAGRLTDG